MEVSRVLPYTAFAILFYTVKCLRYSDFTKTSIIINTCLSKNLLQEIKVDHLLRCSMACSQDTDCRRYLYCESDLSCKTYLDGTDCILPDNSGRCSCYKKNIGCHEGVCTCPLGYYGNNCGSIIKDCVEGFSMDITMGHKKKALTYIQPGSVPFEAVCNFLYKGTVMILARDRSCLHENFNRTMDEYKNGFGIVSSNRWIGLERMFELFSLPHNGIVVIVAMQRSDLSICQTYLLWAELGNEAAGYKMNYQSLGENSVWGGCGTPFRKSLPFSTFDQDYTGGYKCAARFGGGWWFDATADCGRGFLTGTMDGSGTDNFLLDDTTGLSYKSFEIFLEIF